MKMMTFDRRRIRMSLEGWYFTFVLMFIGTAAILRRANLLLILAAMLTAPILFNWRFVMASLRRLVVRRRAPQLAVAGKLFRVGLEISNTSPLDSWHVQIDESICDQEDDRNMSVSVMFDRVPLMDKTTRYYECLIPHRGIYQIKPSVISTSYPLGLIQAHAQIQNGESLAVAPRTGQLIGGWKQWTRPDEVDEPRSVGQQGITDGMFYGIREFRQGDSRRSIHWRSTAKLGKPAVKQFEKQNDLELNLVADLFDPGDGANQSECEVVLSFLATVLQQTQGASRCEINMLTCGEKTHSHHGNATPSFFVQANTTLAGAKSASNQDLQTKINQFASRLHLRSSILVVSTRNPVFRSPTSGAENENGVESPHLTNGFPEFPLRSPSGSDFHCVWLDVRSETFKKIFSPPKELSDRMDSQPVTSEVELQTSSTGV